MARLTRWKVWLPPLVLAAVLVAVLPPGYADWYEWTPRRSSFRASVNAAEARAKEAMGRQAWASGALPEKLASHRAVRRGALLVVAGARVPDSARDAWAEAVTHDAAALPGAATDAGGRTTLVLSSPQAPAGRGVGRYVDPDLDLRAPLGDPCVTFLDSVGLAPSAGAARARGLLGHCSLALAYGAPGSAVRSWALRIRSPFRFRPWGLLLQRWVPPDGAPDHFDGAWEFYYGDYLRGRWRRCAEGDAPSCAYLLDSQTAGQPGGPRSAFVWWLIQRDQGVSFARFWRYAGTLDEASVAAFGVPFATLEAQWLAPRLALPPAGARLPRGAVPKTAALLALAAVVAVLGLRRRQTV